MYSGIPRSYFLAFLNSQKALRFLSHLELTPNNNELPLFSNHFNIRQLLFLFHCAFTYKKFTHRNTPTHKHTHPLRRDLNVKDCIEWTGGKNRRYIYIQTTNIDLNRTLKSNNYNHYFPPVRNFYNVLYCIWFSIPYHLSICLIRQFTLPLQLFVLFFRKNKKEVSLIFHMGHFNSSVSEDVINTYTLKIYFSTSLCAVLNSCCV